ncbi:hypothetical protein BKA80DRAFT_344528 [Phyllosticta citrichinensis]
MDPDGKLRREGMSADNNLRLGPFMIMDYVDGLKLRELWKDPTASRLSWHLKKDISDRDLRIVHGQMARFLLELYKLRFDKIRSLVMDDDGQVSFQGPPLTWTMQEIEAHSGIKAGGDRLEPFESSTEYFDWITNMDWQHLEEQFNSVDDAAHARAKYVFQKLFHKTIPRFVSPEYDSAPFGLVCNDFCYGNMLINNEQDLHIMAVLDWEWSYTAPLERRGELARYKEFLDTFMDELRREEEAQMDDSHGSNSSSSSVDAQPKLSVLMQKSWDDGTFWFNEIILSCYVGGNDTAWKLLCKQYPKIAVADDIDEEALAEFVERKVRWREQYDEIERIYAANSAAKKEKEAQEERDKADSQKGDGQGDGAEGQTGDDGYLARLAALQKPVPLSGDPALHIAAVAWYEVPSGAPPTQL